MKKEGRISIGWRTESNRGLPTKLGKDMNLIESWLMLADDAARIHIRIIVRTFTRGRTCNVLAR